MNTSKKIDVSKASLVSLKAELSRKQDEVNRARVQGAYLHPVPKPKKQTIFSKKNSGIAERVEKDTEEQKEEDVLKKSRAVLEEKTKLYDKLSKSSTGDSRFLVDFQQKVAEEAEETHESEHDSFSDSDDDWAEYVDCLGRTRRCLKEDLAYIKKKDSELSKSLGGVEEKPEAKEDDKEDMDPELLSAHMKREMMRQKWEQQEDKLRNKADVHYQDVLFDEARSHGVGYYSFSQDESQRKSQQESLNKLRQETQREQEATRDVRERRRLQMEARLKAARRRKRERMGLPPEEEEEEEEEAEKEPDTKQEPEQEKEIGPVEEPKPVLKKPPKIRPWDIGKEGMREEMSQEEWVKKRRTERPKEFAPPSTYKPDFIPTAEQEMNVGATMFFSSKKPESERPWHKIWKLASSSDHQTASCSTAPQSQGRGLEICPPCSYDKHARERGVEISPPCSYDEDVRGKGAQIPPPPTFDYYGPTFTARKATSTTTNLGGSIEAGLHFLQQQSKEKQNTREKGLLDIL